MKKIKVDLEERSYNIWVGSGIIKIIHDIVPHDILNRPILVITNKKINRLQGANLRRALGANAPHGVQFLEIPDSEQSKSFEIYSKIIYKLLDTGKKIKPVIIVLGGGVPGDVSGFAASTYRRGIPYIQVPTTLLSQVDSAIGGKVAIDLPQAKNIVGNFFQPSAVIADLDTLKTLPEKEMRHGLAEVIKYGIIDGEGFFSFIEKHVRTVMELKPEALEYIVWKSAAIKASFVEKDEYDKNDERALLNLGHTFAHGIETAFSYSKKYSHGEAVGIGLILAAELSLELNMLSPEDMLRIRVLVKNTGLPDRLEKVSVTKIINAMSYDKKFVSGKNRFVLPAAIGDVRVVSDIPINKIKEVLTRRIDNG